MRGDKIIELLQVVADSGGVLSGDGAVDDLYAAVGLDREKGRWRLTHATRAGFIETNARPGVKATRLWLSEEGWSRLGLKAPDGFETSVENQGREQATEVQKVGVQAELPYRTPTKDETEDLVSLHLQVAEMSVELQRLSEENGTQRQVILHLRQTVSDLRRGGARPSPSPQLQR
jgi:hypothetical protein